MFKDHKSEAQPFFAYAAQLLFRCILVYFIRRAMEQGSDAGLNNRALHEFLMKLNPEKLRNMIDSYEDFGFARTFLPDRELTTDETLGILSELVVMDGRTFVKNFAEKGSFSPVDFIRRGSGVLILVCDQSEASVASPVFRYMMDMMYMALGAQDTKTGRVTFVQDEFATIPRLEKQPMALSLLKYRSAFICGFQDYSQLLSVYGRADAETIAGMYQSIIMMRCSGESVTYVQQRFGTAEVITEYVMPNGTTGQKIEVRPAIEQHEVNAMRIGDAFVKLPNDPPFYFHFNDYSVS
ncbi:MAG: type IV secretion system DNA-binding domain-containing protein, partial [Oscillospiraceae bacterium]|nr:type IV secretion system DNA-binding domain-containing protein [Oscillospiraceae bacterium]